MEKTDQELMEEAFDEAIKEDGKGEGVDVEDITEPEPEVEEADPAPETEDEGVLNAVPADQPANSEEDTTSDEDQTDYKALYEKEVQKNKSWDGRIRAANKRADEAEAALKEAKAKKEKPVVLPDGDEDEVISTFVQEFPELEKPLKLMIHREAKAIAEQQIDQFRPTVDKLESESQQSLAASHFNAIEEAHPGWKTIVESGDLLTWIEAQPAFLQTPLMEVYEKGSSQEVIGMLDSYKKTSTKPKPKREATPPNKKVEKLMAVPSSPSGPPKEDDDVQDFDSAWEEATASDK